MSTYRLYITSLAALILTLSMAVSAVAQTLPSNGKIAFASDQDGDFEIYVMNVDGSNVQQLTVNSVYDNSPVWSPDGSRMLFSSDRNGVSEVFVMNADGSNPTSLTSGLPSFGGRWSPNGTKIAFAVDTNTSSKDLYIMNADGSNKVNLTHDAIHINTLPFWSRDGSRLYFLTDRDYPRSTGKDAPVLDLYTMNTEGSNPIRVFGVGIGITSIDLSPSGSHVVFGIWTLGPTIIVRDLNTSQETVLIDGIQVGGAYPAWSPDGTRMVFVSDGPSLTVMDANGANRSVLLTLDPSKHFHNPDWQPVLIACNTTIAAGDVAGLISTINWE